jgi:DNA-directed RNA polymerase subunit M/transcription elongation factor TFIIS
MYAKDCPNCGHHHMLYTQDWGLWLICPQCGYREWLDDSKSQKEEKNVSDTDC